MAIFFHSRQFHLPRPFSCSQTVTNSIIDGNMRPNVDKHTAPTREINGPKLGIAIATQTVKITNRMRRKYSPKLKSVSEEDRNSNHYLGGLCQHLILRKIERNGGPCAVAILPEAEETDGTVQQYDEEHAGIENTRTTDEMRWCFHIILQGHYLKTNYDS
ncbi:hypothetical protein ALC57_00826 [Trachymyrmex cornetzi]|uniref:Uncharacterized protein n=1 Tax=Trachymyrmex cornetzi TaxID=471704 RepID=A0A151JQS9_9HYME|nr:hypothetical protein ALC57_00826 [Trachymyrmex cornetzi]